METQIDIDIDMDDISYRIWSFSGQVRAARVFTDLRNNPEVMDHQMAVDFAYAFWDNSLQDLKVLEKHEHFVRDNHPWLFRMLHAALCQLQTVIKDLKDEEECYKNHRPPMKDIDAL